MTRGRLIEFLILQNVKTVGDGYEGLPTNWGGLTGIVTQNGPAAGVTGLKAAELLDALKRLFDDGNLSLDKWDDEGQVFRPYSDYSDDNAFFLKGEFRMRLTPGGRLYFEQLEAAVSPEELPPSRKIGF